MAFGFSSAAHSAAMSSEVATEEEKRAVADMARTRGDGLEQRRGTIIVLSPSKQAQN